MDPLHLCVALGPVAVYLWVLGCINLSRRALVTSGLRDATALAIAVSGFVVAGPLKLFLPETAVYRFGPLVWVMLVALYGLGATLAILLMRPRLVFYNMTVDQVRPCLATAVEQLDDQARWAGDSLLLPKLGVQLYIEDFPVMRNVQLVSAGPKQNFAGWRQLELQLRHGLRDFRTVPNPRGVGLLAVAAVMSVAIAFLAWRGQHSVVQSLSELLWLN